MARVVHNAADFKADAAWGALDLTEIDGATVRLHWTDQPYRWHINSGAEAFVVMSGEVDMLFKEAGVERCVRLQPGDIFLAEGGDEHCATPLGEARILVIERKGSV